MARVEPPGPEWHRLRRARRIVVGGAVLGATVGLAAALALGEASAGIALAAVITAAACGAAAVDGAILMVVDQYRGEASTWRRLVVVLGLLASAAFLLALLGTIGAASA